MEQFPLREIQNYLFDSYTLVIEKIPTSKWVFKPHFRHNTIYSGGSPQLIASPQGLKGLDHTSGAPTLKAPTWGASPKVPSCKTKQSLHSWVPLDYNKQKKKVLTGTGELTTAIFPGINTEGSGKPSISQSFPAKGLTAYFKSCYLRIWTIINIYLGAHCNPSWNPKELVGHTHAHSNMR